MGNIQMHKNPKSLLYVKGKVEYKNGKCKTYSEDSRENCGAKVKDSEEIMSYCWVKLSRTLSIRIKS